MEGGGGASGPAITKQCEHTEMEEGGVREGGGVSGRENEIRIEERLRRETQQRFRQNTELKNLNDSLFFTPVINR